MYDSFEKSWFSHFKKSTEEKKYIACYNFWMKNVLSFSCCWNSLGMVCFLFSTLFDAWRPVLKGKLFLRQSLAFLKMDWEVVSCITIIDGSIQHLSELDFDILLSGYISFLGVIVVLALKRKKKGGVWYLKSDLQSHLLTIYKVRRDLWGSTF